MKYLLVLLALGPLVCTTLAAPGSSSLQQEDPNSANEEFLDMLSHATKASHQSDEDADDTLAEAQWIRKFFRGLSLQYKPVIKKWLKKVIRSHMSPQQNKEDEENAVIEAALNNKLDSIVEEQGDDYDDGGDAKASQSDEDDDDSAEAQGWFHRFRDNKLVRKLARKAIGHVIKRYYMNSQQDNRGEENAMIEAILNSELESIAKEQGFDYDDGGDAKANQDDKDDDDSAEAQGWFRSLRKLSRNRLVRKLAGRAFKHVVGRYYMDSQQDNRGEENAMIEAALNSELESIAKEQGDDYDE